MGRRTPAGPSRHHHFNPPTSCEVGRFCWVTKRNRKLISIHPPPARWDGACQGTAAWSAYFNPPTSCEVGLARWRCPRTESYFNPPTSCEVGPFLRGVDAIAEEISIHPPPARWDGQGIKSLRQEGIFQSTHLLRGGTRPHRSGPARTKYFNPPTSCEVGHCRQNAFNS